jgi:O-acetylhomoserine/O-acetylserine sulfhydrylase-like pyridoxal-dependent enzyme
LAQSNGRENWRFETIAVHGGYSPDPTTKSIAVPIGLEHSKDLLSDVDHALAAV